MLRRIAIALAAIAWVCINSSAVRAQGLVLPFGGAMHSGMAGTSTAVGVDAISGLYWNPAVISGLQQNEVTIGSQLLIPHTGLTSTGPSAVGGPIISGRTASDSGLVPTTAIGLVYRQEGSNWTFGMGMSSMAAGGVNFPGDANNPLLAPTGPLGQIVLGPQASAITVLQIAPTASYQVNDCLAVGFSPMVDVSAVSFDPAFFGPLSSTGPLAPQQFPTGSHSRPFWGGGFRGGVTYKPTNCVTTGFSYTSPQWFETWEFNTRDASGNAFTLRVPFSLPQIFSTGVAYTGIEKLLLAADLRYFDYSTTKLMGQPIQQGGAGWKNIWAVSFGGKYQVTDRVAVLAGYLFNENPIPGNLALFNTLLPAITEHTITCGMYSQVNDNIGISLGYVHGFENTISGSVLQFANTNTAIDSKYDAIVFGFHVKFGGSHCRESACCTSCSPSSAPAVEMPVSR